MTKRVTPARCAALSVLCGLAACASSGQGKLKQSVYDIDSAYHVMAEPMPDVMAGKLPGVTLTDAEKTLVKSASQSVFNEITSLETSIEGGKSITATAVSALETDFASLEACWTGVKAGQQPSACAGLATTITTGN
ncbi:hypothetical protein CFR73_09790 [Novacetimonas maltaceti]|uniref:Lipoprotein n=1 Tax=Novacetimonas maltaceti TaxID=1203393 RepID=A0A2S3W406_9PROT|nr:hypothetical protein [Novacetimonas maltaceti]POF63599.1 hypothetical protein KMAL_07790 [Novacetimonas maltaceti]PYD59867.1 hypothetical protein CFR73_09790 [Novacetimonas maltaceti]